MQAGARIGDRYELTYPIARGGMGEVWAGYDANLERSVAVKFLRRELLADDEREVAVKRFMREARVTARLDHPGVPTIHDVGSYDRNVYVVMQLVPGIVLADLIAERVQLPVPWAAAIGAQVCSVLATAHAASLVHRDLKPQNIMVTPAGQVKVLDFGVAALLESAEISRLTASGQTLGTPAYIAPEQVQNETVGPRADLYALGCVLFETLTGSPPYPADSPVAIVHRHLYDPIPSVVDHRPDAPDDLARLIASLMAKNPDRRPRSAAQVYEAMLPLATMDIETDGQGHDPTAPCRRPLGPLPQPAPRPSASL
ncbi:serine/threonine protein kinase [Micromonospora sp. CPCC 205371]|nr:serine/threonine protein kinase [Micromonospora sp. CPCC 205371]